MTTLTKQSDDDFQRALEDVNNRLFLETISDEQAIDEYASLLGSKEAAYDYYSNVYLDNIWSNLA